MPLYPSAQWIPSPHFNPGPTTKRYVIIHGTGYSLNQTSADVAHDFQTTNPNSTHFAIGRAGDVAQMVQVEDIAWGNGIIQAGPNHGSWWTGDPNQYTVSIEHVNDSANSTWPSPQQMQASISLVAWLCKTYNIPARPADATGGITGHYSIESVDRAYCPGAYFWSQLWSALGVPVSFTRWLAPGAQAFSEFARQSSGVYHTATCVEAAALSCAVGQKPGLLPLSGDELQTMINQWHAADPAIGPNGASSYVDATTWLRGLGFTVDENIMSGNWWSDMQAGLEARCVFLVGVTNAQGLPGDEQGVHNHGLAALGIDEFGNIICSDPDNALSQVNMPGNPIGQLVTYTQQDFTNGSISSLTKVYPAMLISDPNFTIISDQDWECVSATKLPSEVAGSESKKHITLGLLDAYRGWPAQGLNAGVTAFGLPLSNAIYPDQAKYPGVVFQFFQRGILVWDPTERFFDPSGTRGQSVYAANLDDVRFAGYLAIGSSSAPPASDDEAAEAAQLATLQAQIAADTGTITGLQTKLAAIQADVAKLASDVSALQQDAK